MMDDSSNVFQPKRAKVIRNSNWSEREKDVIIEQCTKNANIIHGAISSNLTMFHKNKIWQEITDNVNAVGGANRTLNQVKNKWKNLRSRSIDKVRGYNREFNKTGKVVAMNGNVTYLYLKTL